MRRERNPFQKLTGERERERRVCLLVYYIEERKKKKKLDPEKKEREALECENSWEEEIKTKYIYIYRNWAFHNLFLTKNK